MNHSNIVTSIKEKMNQFRISNAALSDEISALKQTLSENSIKIEEYENKVATLTRKVAQLEDENEKLELNFASQTEKLNTSIQMADDSERLKAALSQQYNAELDVKDKISCNVKSLEDKLTEFENKYRELSQRSVLLESTTSKLEEENQNLNEKITQKDYELTQITLQIKSEQHNLGQASQREDAHKESIRELSDKFKESDNRCSEAERTVTKLQKEVDRLEDDLENERKKYNSMMSEFETEVQNLSSI